MLSPALDHLTLGRAALFERLLGHTGFVTALSELNAAVVGLRRAGTQDYLPRGLLARAWFRALAGPRTGSDSAQEDLDEAWEIAERGPMPLFLADIHLHRARLFFREVPYPWAEGPDGAARGPKDDLADARVLIEKHGYWRRREELADAEAAARDWPDAVPRPSVPPVVPELAVPAHSPLPPTPSEVPMHEITGPEIGALRDALVSAFSPESFDQMLRVRLNKNREALVGGGPLKTVTFELISLAVREGWVPNLIRAAQEENPGNLALKRFCDAHPHLVAGGADAPAAAQATNLISAHWNESNGRQHVIPTPAAAEVRPIVLVTVNEHETDAVLDAFLGAGQVPPQVTKGGVTYNRLGDHGGQPVVHTVCEMGAGGVGAAQQRTREAIEHWRPAAVVAVGIAFGIDETKQKIGDVLVSRQLQDYELGRLNADGTVTPRGDRPSCSDTLRNRLVQTDVRERRRTTTDWPKVRFGLVLSGQKLVDNLDYRESLKKLFTEAVGGEMEGVGLYVSATAGRTDWIVVKAICDWGHDKNQADKDAWQKLAAANAARVIKAALDTGRLYEIPAAPGATGSVPGAPARPAPATAPSTVLSAWQERLEFLRVEQTKAVGAAEKFNLVKEIEDAEANVRKYGGQP